MHYKWQADLKDKPDVRAEIGAREPADPPSINYLVHKLASSLARGSSAYYGRKFGVSLPESRIMSTLVRYGDASARDLVERTAMDKAMVSRVLSALKKKGLVKLRDNGTRMRLRDCTLTKKGRELVKRMQPVWKRREASIQSGLSEQEKRQLTDLLMRVIDCAEQQRLRETEELGREE